MLDKLSIEDIKASVTELMAGGVDTVKIVWTHVDTMQKFFPECDLLPVFLKTATV